MSEERKGIELVKENLTGTQIIGTLTNELGDEWRCYLKDGVIILDGSDIYWEQRNAEDHELDLDVREAQWLRACIGVGRMLPRYGRPESSAT